MSDSRSSNKNLRRRFAFLLGSMAVATLALFVGFQQYAQHNTEKVYEQRGYLLAETIGSQSVFNLMMGDSEGLKESLDALLSRNTAQAGAFFTAEGELLAQVGFAPAEAENPMTGVALEQGVQYGELNGNGVLFAVDEVRREAEAENELPLGYSVVAISTDTLVEQRAAGWTLVGVVLLFLGGVTWFILRRIGQAVIKPLEELKEAAQAVEGGDLTARVAITQDDEIGELATSFNAMVEASERSLEAVKEQIRQTEAAEALKAEAEENQRYLQAQFDEIATVIAAVTDGDLTQRLTPTRNDAVGQLMTQVNAMIDDLETLIEEVKVSGEQIAEAAHSVSSAAEEMSAGAREQAEQTSEVASAVEQMSVTIDQSSGNAQVANERATQASMLAAHGGEAFQKTRDGIERIATLVQGSMDEVTELGQSSSQIGEIIQVIGDIADQTNLLALNAAIEAARAGDQGRGFAVVADEVRKLAERTTQATRKIGEMITRIQENTRKVVASMERGNEEVRSGMTLADNAAHSIEEIIGGIDGMVEMINQIAAASQEQAVTSTQIAHNVETFAAVAGEVSTSTTDLARTAEVMNDHASTLRQRIERFRLSDDAGAHQVDEAPRAQLYRLQGDGHAVGLPSI
ncbi:MAG: methyl-accepting chemotaxis protein [Rhodothermales bacterium]